MKSTMVPFLTEAEIFEIIDRLAKEIDQDHEGRSLLLVCPLKGSVFFFSDLVKRLKTPLEVDFVQLSSPKGQSVQVVKDISVDATGKDILIVEEIIDAGRTLNFLKTRLGLAQGRSVKIVALLDKPARREIFLKPDYVGKVIDDRYLVGYGMDSEEYGRNLRDIYSLAQ